MSSERSISQRDLRLRSREIMDAVERGDSFTVTRGGRGIAALVPLQGRRTFVPVDEFVALGHGLEPIDADQFRADVDAGADPHGDDAFLR